MDPIIYPREQMLAYAIRLIVDPTEETQLNVSDQLRKSLDTADGIKDFCLSVFTEYCTLLQNDIKQEEKEKIS